MSEDRDAIDPEPGAQPASFSVLTELTNQRDSDGKLRSFSMVETWGSAKAEGWSVEFVRSLSGMKVELRLEHPDGRRADYAFSLEPTLQTAIGLAVKLASRPAPLDAELGSNANDLGRDVLPPPPELGE